MKPEDAKERRRRVWLGIGAMVGVFGLLVGAAWVLSTEIINPMMNSFNYQAEKTAWLSEHTLNVTGEVTQVKEWQGQSCGFLFGGCASVLTENVTFTFHVGPPTWDSGIGGSATAEFPCSYFTLNQTVAGIATPFYPGPLAQPSNSSYGYETHVFSYALRQIPGGC